MLKIKVEFEGEVVSRIFRTFNFSFSTGRLLVEVDSAVSPMGTLPSAQAMATSSANLLICK